MNYMLDINILIYLIKNKPPAIADKINALDKADELLHVFFHLCLFVKRR